MMKEYEVLLWFYKTEDGNRKTELNTFFPYRPVLFFDEKNYRLFTNEIGLAYVVIELEILPCSKGYASCKHSIVMS